MDKMHKVAEELLIRDKLDGEEFKLLMAGEELPEFEPRAGKLPINLKTPTEKEKVEISQEGIDEAQRQINESLLEKQAETPVQGDDSTQEEQGTKDDKKGTDL